jgi:hypothetical protein
MPVPDSFTLSRSQAPLSESRPGRGAPATAQLTEDVTGRVNASGLDLVTGNALLAAVGLAPLEPGVPVDFLVPVCLHVHDHTPARPWPGRGGC